MSSTINPAKDCVKEIIKEDGFRTYAVRFDIDDKGDYFYDLNTFVNALLYELPDFAFGGEYWKGITPENPMEAVAEAAKSIYKINEFKKLQEMCLKDEVLDDDIDDKLLRRGEFGELILFFLLKRFNDAIPLLSKIYFKDTDGATVHGFDAVHYHEASHSLWLGESKIYHNSKQGISALIEDIKEHILSDYLKREFTLIGKKFVLAPSIEVSKRDEILKLLNPQESLEGKIEKIFIPLLCTFPAKTYDSFNKESADFTKAYVQEMRALEKHFYDNNDHPLKDHLNIVLLLMPIKSKKDLIKMIHERLTQAQSIIV
jgi:hypothetical protein